MTPPAAAPPLRALFFDAGNTLVFFNRDCLEPLLLRRNLHVEDRHLRAAEAAAKHRLDQIMLETGHVDAHFWELFFTELLRQAGCDDPQLVREFVPLARTSGNWSVVVPHAGEVLASLRPRYKLGVISNSDGGIARLLQRCGLLEFFDSVTDSRLVGFEKPDPRIFRAAAETLECSPEECVYIGDIFSIDYLGARRAGLHAVLMDSAGVYENISAVRVSSLEELPAALARL